MKQKVQGVAMVGLELSLQGANWPGSEKAVILRSAHPHLNILLQAMALG